MSEVNNCGTCTMCCKVLKVTEIQKPAGEWCKHCDKGVGCKIYHVRPEPCRVFECVWLKTQKTEHPLPVDVRPDSSNVVMGTTLDGKRLVFYVNPGYPNAWREGKMATLIRERAAKGDKMIVVVGKKIYGINVKPEQIKSHVDEKGHTMIAFEDEAPPIVQPVRIKVPVIGQGGKIILPGGSDGR